MPPEVVVIVFESLDSLRTAINLETNYLPDFWSLYKRLQATICLHILPLDLIFGTYEHGDQIQTDEKLYPKLNARWIIPRERAALSWHAMHIAQGALYDLWTFSALGEYLHYDSDDHIIHPQNPVVDYHMCHVLSRLDWYHTGFPDPLSVLEYEARDVFWGEGPHEDRAVITITVAADERESSWEEIHWTDSGGDGGD
jgi:hypothetical protein